MKKAFFITWVVCSSFTTLLESDFPQATISNKVVQMKLYLPDASRGYYQGTRFDWAGVVASLEYQDHQYFGQWFEKYDPRTHDAIMGPVEEFMALGYEEAAPGGTFVKVGVGVLRKPDSTAYAFSKT